MNRRFFLWMGASALIASACTKATQSRDPSLASASNDVKRVKHAFGETEVPTSPTRIIVMGYATVEAVVAHGVQPIGVPTGVVDGHPHLSLDGNAVLDIGAPGKPNFEKMTVLKPDLILTSKNRVRDAYPLLAQVAPTVVLDIENNAEWKELTRLCGEALGKPTKTEKLAADYEAKLRKVRNELSQNSQQLEVSIIFLFPGRVGAMGTETFAGSILADVGIARPPSQAQAQGPQNLSLESLDLLDGDVIFIVTLQGGTELAKESRAEINRMQAHPLWSQLRAVQTNRVYEVGSHWGGGSYIAANLILDDLLKFGVGSL
ncbi:MAG: iron-siderophore ABC transporter substrate-binding protein [Leptolyngbya sp. SIO1E4]|nr:iron-siderophore ABC transporter substrate-binding protein [Leptolyngbya sp. SIO1E4]